MSKIDSNFVETNKTTSTLKYYNPMETSQMKLTNFPWLKQDKKYFRLPVKDFELINTLNPRLIILQGNTAGGQLRFKTNSSSLSIKAKVYDVANLSIMPLASQMGFDLYVGENAKDLKYYNTTRVQPNVLEYEYTMFEKYEKKMRYILINFPQYASIEHLEIGLDQECTIEQVEDFSNNGKIIIYGTSIIQGGCCSRPGLNITNALSRKLDMEVLNFGFSGNGFGEKEIIDMISDIDDIKAFIFDYEANAGTNGKMALTLKDDIELVRKKYPFIPIINISRIPYIFEDLNETLKQRRNNIKQFQIDLINKFNTYDNNVFFVDGSKFLDTDYYDCTVDTIHPNDIGFERITKNYLKMIERIIKIKPI